MALVRNITSHFHLGADTRDLATEFASVYLWKNDESTCECVELIAATAVIVAAKLLQQSSDVGIVCVTLTSHTSPQRYMKLCN